MLTGQLLCRSRAEDLRAQLLEFQAPREESRPQMVDWLKSSAGEAKQVGVWCSECPAAASYTPNEPPSESSMHAQQCALEQPSMCSRGALEWVSDVSAGVLSYFLLCAIRVAPCMAPVCQQGCPGSGLHVRQWVQMHQLKVCLAGQQK